MLGLVVRGATGKPLADYLSEKIWQPMGAEADATWMIDKAGYEIGFSGINATVRDYGRLGMLRGLRGQAVYVDPKTRVVMVQTAAGNLGETGTGETLSLWDAAVAHARRR